MPSYFDDGLERARCGSRLICRIISRLADTAKGGNRIWGHDDAAPVSPLSPAEPPSPPQDDPPNATDSHGRFFSFRRPEASSDEKDLTRQTVPTNLTMDEASSYVLLHTPSSFQRMIATNYSYGFETDEQRLKENDRDHRKVSVDFLSETKQNSYTAYSGLTLSKLGQLAYTRLAYTRLLMRPDRSS